MLHTSVPRFMSKSDWVELGGSQLAAEYLATVDEEGLGSVAPCDVDETRCCRASRAGRGSD